MADYVDFKIVKAEVPIEAVAARYGVALKRTNGSHERGKCPLPTHPVGDDAKSFSINVNKQVWICHSSACAKGRRGKKGGDVIELVAVMERCSLRDAGLKLASWFGILMSERDRGAAETKPRTETKSEGEATDRYGSYGPLALWIEERLEGNSLSRFEQSAYLSVLGHIEELASGGGVRG